jgi:transposase
VSATLMELLDENRELKQALHEKERALLDRDTLLSQHLQRIVELEFQIETLATELRSAGRDQRKLEARLKELLSKRRALADLLAPGQLALVFGEEPLPTPPCVNEAPDGETSADKIRPRHRRTREPRQVAYAALPREHVQHELALEQRVCPVTGKSLVAIGEKTTEELEYRPAQLVVIVHHRAVYGLSAEDHKQRTIEPLVTPAPARAVENAQAGPGLLAWIMVQKYCHHLPLYRQQAIFEREGLALPRQTLCDWVLASAYQLGPIQQALRRQIVASGLVQLDDTPVQCQGGPREKNFQAHLWAYLSPRVAGVVYDFTPDRTHEHVLDFLGEDLAGWLLGDGYAGYGTIAGKRPGLVRFSRRVFLLCRERRQTRRHRLCEVLQPKRGSRRRTASLHGRTVLRLRPCVLPWQRRDVAASFAGRVILRTALHAIAPARHPGAAAAGFKPRHTVGGT